MDQILEFLRKPLVRNVLISIAAAIPIFAFLARDELPTTRGAWYALIYKLNGCVRCDDPNFVLLGAGLPRPKLTVKERTDLVIAALHAKSDMELRAIGVAQKPCASQLLDCQGLAENFVKGAALAEITQRAKDVDQKIAQSAAQAARESALAAVQSAEAAQRNAAIAERTIWLTAIGSAITGGGLLFAGLTYRETRRKNRQLPSTTTP